MSTFTRRDFLKSSVVGAVGLAGATAASRKHTGTSDISPSSSGGDHGHGRMGTIGEVDHEANGFDPIDLLTDWDYGKVSKLPSGQVLREYHIVAVDKELEIAPGVFFPAWTYNGRVPGPSLRCVEGDRIIVNFINFRD